MEEESVLASSPPCEWGLPSKFSSWRPGQPRIVQDIIDCPTDIKVSCIPTGVGKSPSYTLAAVLKGARACILTETKPLQDQLETDFRDIGMVDVRGKSNYKCKGRPGLTCEEAGAICKAAEWNDCSHRNAVKAACRAKLVVTNYATWLNRNYMARNGACAFTKANPEDDPNPFDMLIMDEAHQSLNELSSLIAVDLTKEDMLRYIRSVIPENPLPMAEWKKYAEEMLPQVRRRTTDMETAIKQGIHMDNGILREYVQMNRIVTKLQTLAGCNPDMWTVEPYAQGFKFDPVWPAVYAKYLLHPDIHNVVMVSATIRPKTLHLLGLKEDQFTFDEYPSPFNPSDAPIYHIPTTRIWHGSPPEDLQLMYNRIDEIIGSRLDRKGLIHSVSYTRATAIRDASEYKRYMMLNNRGYGAPTTAEVVAKFLRSQAPSYLVSPSVTTGFDFSGNACEVNIIPKLSVPDQRSVIMQERLKRDPEYGDYLTITDLMQACGRGNRFIGDRCQTFITDDVIKRYMRRRRNLFPKDFFERFRTSNTVPAPLAKMP